MAKFKLRDHVKRIGTQEVRTVEEIREGAGEPLYSLQLGSDFTTRIWAKESELEAATKTEQEKQRKENMKVDQVERVFDGTFRKKVPLPPDDIPPTTSPDARSRKCKKCGYIGFVGDHCPKGHGELTETL